MMCARLFTKGAAEQVLELCNLRIRDDSGVARFSQQEKQELLDSFGQDGNRWAVHRFSLSWCPGKTLLLHWAASTHHSFVYRIVLDTDLSLQICLPLDSVLPLDCVRF